MAQYIDKSALVAEIDKLEKQDFSIIDDLSGRNAYLQGVNDVLEVLDSLEVKEVDFNKEFVSYYKHTNDSTISLPLAKHFFELGLKASYPLTWEDINMILDALDEVANDDSMEEKLNTMSQEEYCKEVLKRFNAQKGE